jgi:hypothetical protein
MALLQLVPTKPAAGPKGRDRVGTAAVGTGIRMKNRLQPPDLSRWVA